MRGLYADGGAFVRARRASTGRLLAVIGAGGSGHGGDLFCPTGVSTDAQGNLYVAELSGNRISKFDSSGHFVLAFGKDVVAGGGTGFEVCTVAAKCKAGLPGDQAGEFNFPEGITTDAAGSVYVSDLENSRVQEFDGSGEVVRVIASTASPVFRGPAHISTNAAGQLFVADAGNSEIQQFADAPPPPPGVAPRLTHVTESHSPGVRAIGWPPWRRRSGLRSARGSPASSTSRPA